MNLRIRRARADEAALLTRLARTAKGSWNYPAEWLSDWQDQLTITSEYLSQQQVLVADTAEGVSGMAALEVGEEGARLEHVWVHPGHQGAGVGRALVAEALQIAAGMGRQRVSVVSDPNAEPFYRRLGAKGTGSVPAPMPGAPGRVLPVLEFILKAS